MQLRIARKPTAIRRDAIFSYNLFKRFTVSDSVYQSDLVYLGMNGKKKTLNEEKVQSIGVFLIQAVTIYKATRHAFTSNLLQFEKIQTMASIMKTINSVLCNEVLHAGTSPAIRWQSLTQNNFQKYNVETMT